VPRRRADQRHRPGLEQFVEVADGHLTPEVSEAARVICIEAVRVER